VPRFGKTTLIFIESIVRFISRNAFSFFLLIHCIQFKLVKKKKEEEEEKKKEKKKKKKKSKMTQYI